MQAALPSDYAAQSPRSLDFNAAGPRPQVTRNARGREPTTHQEVPRRLRALMYRTTSLRVRFMYAPFATMSSTP
jgi:hypothetical protein